MWKIPGPFQPSALLRSQARLGLHQIADDVGGLDKGAVLPLVPYLDTLRWLFIALALGGIAVAAYARLDDWRKGRR